MWGVLLVPSSSPTLSPIYDGVDVNVTSNATWFHLDHDMVSRRIYKLCFYGGHSITKGFHIPLKACAYRKKWVMLLPRGIERYSVPWRVRGTKTRAYYLVVVGVVVVLTLTRIIKSVVTGQAPVTLELRNTPGKNTHNPRWYTHISQPTQFMPPPETYKSEIGSQSTMCQFQAGPCVSLLTPGETKYSDCHPRKTTTYTLHVISITTHTHDRRKSIGKKETKKRKVHTSK